MNSTFLKVWKAPIVLACVTSLGLIMALVGSGMWHWFSWTALSIPLLVCLRYGVFTKNNGK